MSRVRTLFDPAQFRFGVRFGRWFVIKDMQKLVSSRSKKSGRRRIETVPSICDCGRYGAPNPGALIYETSSKCMSCAARSRAGVGVEYPREWFVIVGSAVEGPLTKEQVKTLITRGYVTVDQKISKCQKDDDQWHPIKKTGEFLVFVNKFANGA